MTSEGFLSERIKEGGKKLTNLWNAMLNALLQVILHMWC